MDARESQSRGGANGGRAGCAHGEAIASLSRRLRSRRRGRIQAKSRARVKEHVKSTSRARQGRRMMLFRQAMQGFTRMRAGVLPPLAQLRRRDKMTEWELVAGCSARKNWSRRIRCFQRRIHRLPVCLCSCATLSHNV